MTESEDFEPDPSAEMDLTPAPQTATPAGDWFAARARVRTHAMDGADGSPGCWSWHPSCAYEAGKRETQRELAAETTRLRERAERAEAKLEAIRRGVSPATVFYAEAAASDLAQELAERAESHATVTDGAGTGNARGADGRGPENCPQPRAGDAP